MFVCLYSPFESHCSEKTKRKKKEKTRPDTRQSSCGRFGRSSHAKTARNQKMLPTDGATETARCRITCPRLGFHAWRIWGMSWTYETNIFHVYLFFVCFCFFLFFFAFVTHIFRCSSTFFKS